MGNIRVWHRLGLPALLVAGLDMATRSTTPARQTWGLAAYYNPTPGGVRPLRLCLRAVPRHRRRTTWNPRTGTYARGGAAWGPRGTAGFVGAYNPRSDRGGFVAGGRNVYGAWKSAGVTRGSEWARVTARSNAAGGSSLRWNTSNGQGFIREGRRGDIYAGRDGNVYRNSGDGWQKFDGGWQDVGRPEPKTSSTARGCGISGRRRGSACRSGAAERRSETSPAQAPPERPAPLSASGWPAMLDKGETGHLAPRANGGRGARPHRTDRQGSSAPGPSSAHRRSSVGKRSSGRRSRARRRSVLHNARAPNNSHQTSTSMRKCGIAGTSVRLPPNNSTVRRATLLPASGVVALARETSVGAVASVAAAKVSAAAAEVSAAAASAEEEDLAGEAEDFAASVRSD